MPKFNRDNARGRRPHHRPTAASAGVDNRPGAPVRAPVAAGSGGRAVIEVACLGDSHLTTRHLPAPNPVAWLLTLVVQWLRSPGTAEAGQQGNQLVVPGLGGDKPEDWFSLGFAASRIRPVPSAILVSLGSNGLSRVAESDQAGLTTCLATMRAGLASLLGMLRMVAPDSVVILMTPVPRSAMTVFHRNAFRTASGLFAEVASQSGGHVLSVTDVVRAALLGNTGTADGDTDVMPPAAYESGGVHLSSAAGEAVADGVRDIILRTYPMPGPLPGMRLASVAVEPRPTTEPAEASH